MVSVKDAGMNQEPARDEWHQAYLDSGYDWCRPCREYHRPPECAIDQDGVPELEWDEVA